MQPEYKSQSENKGKEGPLALDKQQVAGMNLLKFHLRPPARRGCADSGKASL